MGTVRKINTTIDDISPSIAKVNQTIDALQPAIQRVDPLLERVSLTVDAVNLEIMRADQILADLGEVTDVASDAVGRVAEITDAPLNRLTSASDKMRNFFSGNRGKAAHERQAPEQPAWPKPQENDSAGDKTAAQSAPTPSPQPAAESTQPAASAPIPEASFVGVPVPEPEPVAVVPPTPVAEPVAFVPEPVPAPAAATQPAAAQAPSEQATGQSAVDESGIDWQSLSEAHVAARRSRAVAHVADTSDFNSQTNEQQPVAAATASTASAATSNIDTAAALAPQQQPATGIATVPTAASDMDFVPDFEPDEGEVIIDIPGGEEAPVEGYYLYNFSPDSAAYTSEDLTAAAPSPAISDPFKNQSQFASPSGSGIVPDSAVLGIPTTDEPVVQPPLTYKSDNNQS
jgi:hypothetical protein